MTDLAKESNFPFINNGMRTDVSENNIGVCQRESEAVFLSDIRFPNSLSAMVTMNVQRRMLGILQKKLEFIIETISGYFLA